MCFCADYGFEYSDDEPEEEDVDIENQYYNAKGALQAAAQASAAGHRCSARGWAAWLALRGAQGARRRG